MAYDTPKAAHFELRDIEGIEILTNEGINYRWAVAGVVAEKFPCLAMLGKSEVEEIDMICESLSRDGIKVIFRHHREFN